MSVYLLPLALSLLVLGAAWVLGQWVRRRIRRALFVKSASFDAQPRTLGAHDKLTLTANVTPVGGHRLRVQGVVACALLEHRERRIHEHAYDMTGDKMLLFLPLVWIGLLYARLPLWTALALLIAPLLRRLFPAARTLSREVLLQLPGLVLLAGALVEAILRFRAAALAPPY